MDPGGVVILYGTLLCYTMIKQIAPNAATVTPFAHHRFVRDTTVKGPLRRIAVCSSRHMSGRDGQEEKSKNRSMGLSVLSSLSVSRVRDLYSSRAPHKDLLVLTLIASVVPRNRAALPRSLLSRPLFVLTTIS